MFRYDLIAVYLMASGRNGTLYLGVTTDLPMRALQHRNGESGGFPGEYSCTRLVWYEQHALLADAIEREKAIKKWRRAWKLALIEKSNPQWRDLYEDFLQPPPPSFLSDTTSSK